MTIPVARVESRLRA